jgi:membrane-bound lytic murein transglycosylase B
VAVQDQIIAIAEQYGVDPNLALALATVESGLNQSAVSSAGAIGIFQLIPGTAESLGVDPTDPNQNIQGGVEYLAQLLAQFGGDPYQAVAAYDDGPTKVAAAIATYGTTDYVIASPGGPPMPAWLASLPSETQNEVFKVFGNYDLGSLPGGSPATAAPTSSPAAGSSGSMAVSEASILGGGSSTWLLLIGAGVLALLWAFDDN